MADAQPTEQPSPVQLSPRIPGVAAAYLAFCLSEKLRLAVSGCWEWIGSKNSKGYGIVHLKHHEWPERTVAVHRLAYRLCVGELIDGMCVCHRCDNPACARPGHLFQATNDDNVADKMAKGRHRSPVGESHGSARLTAELVMAIRNRAAGGESYASIARDTGYSEATVADAAKGRTWSHLPAASALDLVLGKE